MAEALQHALALLKPYAHTIKSRYMSDNRYFMQVRNVTTPDAIAIARAIEQHDPLIFCDISDHPQGHNINIGNREPDTADHVHALATALVGLGLNYPNSAALATRGR